MLVGLQDIWDNDKNVYFKVFEQLATSWRQSMASTFNELKFQNVFSLALWLHVRILGQHENKQINFTIKMAKKLLWCKVGSIQVTWTCLQHGDGLVIVGQ